MHQDQIARLVNDLLDEQPIWLEGLEPCDECAASPGEDDYTPAFVWQSRRGAMRSRRSGGVGELKRLRADRQAKLRRAAPGLDGRGEE